MDQNFLDTNIDYFSRHLEKIRKWSALFCISLIIIATLPFLLITLQTGWGVASLIQSVVILFCVGLFQDIYRHGYRAFAGRLILFADVALIATGLIRPDSYPSIVMFFFTPPLIAYLFFRPKHALITTIVSYCFLNSLYLYRYNDFSTASAQYELFTIFFSGIAFIVGLHLIVISRHRVERKLMQVAHSDALTGIPNRMHFESRIVQEINRCQREGKTLCLALVDVDHFKKINDQYGHDVGDKMLVHIASVLESGLRIEDIQCRFGGEEFVIIMTNTHLTEAIGTLERARNKIEQVPLNLGGQSITATVSIGCAELNTTTYAYDVLFDEVDKRLYNAKDNGRNRVCFE